MKLDGDRITFNAWFIGLSTGFICCVIVYAVLVLCGVL